jgi:hypothetical protein
MPPCLFVGAEDVCILMERNNAHFDISILIKFLKSITEMPVSSLLPYLCAHIVISVHSLFVYLKSTFVIRNLLSFILYK